jgi:hypothetical protein
VAWLRFSGPVPVSRCNRSDKPNGTRTRFRFGCAYRSYRDSRCGDLTKIGRTEVAFERLHSGSDVYGQLREMDSSPAQNYGSKKWGQLLNPHVPCQGGWDVRASTASRWSTAADGRQSPAAPDRRRPTTVGCDSRKRSLSSACKALTDLIRTPLPYFTIDNQREARHE